LAWGNEYLNKLIEAGVPATSAAKKIKFKLLKIAVWCS